MRMFYGRLLMNGSPVFTKLLIFQSLQGTVKVLTYEEKKKYIIMEDFPIPVEQRAERFAKVKG